MMEVEKTLTTRMVVDEVVHITLSRVEADALLVLLGERSGGLSWELYSMLGKALGDFK